MSEAMKWWVAKGKQVKDIRCTNQWQLQVVLKAFWEGKYNSDHLDLNLPLMSSVFSKGKELNGVFINNASYLCGCENTDNAS